MIKSLLFILLVCAGSLHYSDLGSASAWHSIVLPLVATIALIALALWVVVWFHRRGIDQRSPRGGTGLDFFDGDSGGGDGGY